MPNAAQLEQKTAEKIWPVAKSDFDDPACKSQRADFK
jgi:hypothetical protein